MATERYTSTSCSGETLAYVAQRVLEAPRSFPIPTFKGHLVPFYNGLKLSKFIVHQSLEMNRVEATMQRAMGYALQWAATNGVHKITRAALKALETGQSSASHSWIQSAVEGALIHGHWEAVDLILAHPISIGGVDSSPLRLLAAFKNELHLLRVSAIWDWNFGGRGRDLAQKIALIRKDLALNDH